MTNHTHPHEDQCSFCRKPRDLIASLVVSSRTSICDGCVASYRDQRPFLDQLKIALVGYRGTPSKLKITVPYRDASTTGCHFCSKEHKTIYSHDATRICDPCLERAHEVLLHLASDNMFALF